jgi:hypothetical protein
MARSLSHTLAITNVAEIASVLDWRSILELGGPELLLNVPMRTTISRRIEEGTLQGCHSSIDSTFAPAWDTCERVFGGATEGYSVRWR